MRAYLLTTDCQADVTLISVLAYAGLRPGEAMRLRWHDLGQRSGRLLAPLAERITGDEHVRLPRNPGDPEPP